MQCLSAGVENLTGMGTDGHDEQRRLARLRPPLLRQRRGAACPGLLHTARQCEAERLRRSDPDQDPIVWVFFIEQEYEKWWS
jgi:hypothetical protein